MAGLPTMIRSASSCALLDHEVQHKNVWLRAVSFGKCQDLFGTEDTLLQLTVSTAFCSVSCKCHCILCAGPHDR